MQWIHELPVRSAHAAGVTRLAPHHNDPFDRLLIAQALAEPLTFLTPTRCWCGTAISWCWCKEGSVAGQPLSHSTHRVQRSHRPSVSEHVPCRRSRSPNHTRHQRQEACSRGVRVHSASLSEVRGTRGYVEQRAHGETSRSRRQRVGVRLPERGAVGTVNAFQPMNMASACSSPASARVRAATAGQRQRAVFGSRFGNSDSSTSPRDDAETIHSKTIAPAARHTRCATRRPVRGLDQSDHDQVTTQVLPSLRKVEHREREQGAEDDVDAGQQQKRSRPPEARR